MRIPRLFGEMCFNYQQNSEKMKYTVQFANLLLQAGTAKTVLIVQCPMYIDFFFVPDSIGT